MGVGWSRQRQRRQIAAGKEAENRHFRAAVIRDAMNLNRQQRSDRFRYLSKYYPAGKILPDAIARIEQLEAALIRERFNYLDVLDAQYYPNGDRPDYERMAREQLKSEGLL